jgi:hypothetical protein
VGTSCKKLRRVEGKVRRYFLKSFLYCKVWYVPLPLPVFPFLSSSLFPSFSLFFLILFLLLFFSFSSLPDELKEVALHLAPNTTCSRSALEVMEVRRWKILGQELTFFRKVSSDPNQDHQDHHFKPTGTSKSRSRPAYLKVGLASFRGMTPHLLSD